jgi:hypothetical protein
VNRKTGLATAFLLLFIQFYYCARIESPPGGPPDTTAPEIISVSPAMGQLEVSPDAEIRIGFSEKISKEDVASQVFIVPPPRTPPKFSWKKKDLVISFPDSLEKNRTYLITLKTGLKDLRRNKLSQPFKLAFSTGKYLDSGQISGRVYMDLKPSAGVDIWAFMYDSNFALFENTPVYVTQTTDSGEYKLEYLADGSYLCFAVKDKAGNRKYEPEDDYLGLPSWSVSIDSLNPIHTGLDFDLHKRDTTKLKMVSAEFTSDLMFSIKLSKSVYAPFVSLQNFEINNVENQAAVAISHIYVYADTTDKILLVPESLPKAGSYIARLNNIFDLQGNGLAVGLDTLSFEVTVLDDTDPPRLVASYPLENEKAFPVDSGFMFVFSEPIAIDSADSALIWIMDADSVLIYGFKCTVDDLILRCKPAEPLKPGQSYTAFLNLPGIYDLTAGNPAGDSVLNYRFTAENTEEYGAISGRLEEGEKISFANTRIFVNSLDNKTIFPLIFDDSLGFALNLPAGKYIFHGFNDSNRDNIYEWGSISPFGFAEPFFMFPDSVAVRSRFETEEIILKQP